MDAIDVLKLIQKEGIAGAIERCTSIDDIWDSNLAEKVQNAQRALHDLIYYCENYGNKDDLRELADVQEVKRDGALYREYRFCGLLHRTDGPALIKIKKTYHIYADSHFQGSWYLFGTSTDTSMISRAMEACDISRKKPCYDKKKLISLAAYILKEFGDRKAGRKYLRRDRIVQFFEAIGEQTLVSSILASIQLAQ
jgi:hypothetical protein